MNKGELIKHIKFTGGHFDGGKFHIQKDKVMYLIDRLDEPEKPVIPQFAAEYIERKKRDGVSLSRAFAYIKEYGWDDDKHYEYKVYGWLGKDSNDEVFARAWLDGYTVEDEKYCVLDKNGYILLRRYEDEGVSFMKISTNLTVKKFEEQAPERLDSILLTEKEIKDYDPRYLAFAIPAEEVTE